MKFGIMSAMHEEIASLKEKLTVQKIENVASRDYLIGTIKDKNVILTHSHWGKVASAITATTLIQKYKVDAIIFTGVAGSVSESVNVGDIVMGSRLYQHDMDARPFFPHHVIPLLGKKYFEASSALLETCKISATKFLTEIKNHISKDEIGAFNLHHAITHVGTIASGDKFIESQAAVQEIMMNSPDTLAVEMEGASVAQVCEAHNVPFLIIRTISDNANKTAAIDFQRFIKNIASVYSNEIICSFLENTR